MATYKQIFGKQIKFLSSDPANEAEGQVWYNSTSQTFKTVMNSGAWSSSAPLNAPMTSLGQGTGIQTAALAAGGHPGSPPYPLTNTSSEYNGSGWAAGGNLNTAGNSASQANNGTQTAALIFARYVGGPSTASEEYNGTSWTTGNARNVGNYRGAGGGTQTAAFATGGYPPSSTAVEEYDGTNWTAGGALPAGRQDSSGAGTQTAGIVMGGDTGPPNTIDLVQTYDGSSWTTGTAMPIERQEHGGVGLQTAALVFGGMTGPGAGTAASVTSASYDGSAWTAGGSLATGRQEGTNAGTSTLALFAGGTPTPAYNLTEEYNVGTTVVEPGAWAAGGTMNDARSWVQGARNGTQTSSLCFSGFPIPAEMQKTEEYNGTAWTSKNNMVGAGRYNGGGTGIVTAAVSAGGSSDSPYTVLNLVEEFDGTDWTVATAFTTARKGGTLVGTQAAAALFGGDVEPTTPRSSGVTEEYNGSTWSPGGTMNTSRVTYNAGAGLQTAGLIWAGNTFPGQTNVTEEYNGTSWTSVNNYLITGYSAAGAGTQTAAFGAGMVEPTGTVGKTFTYDGTDWATAPSLGTARYSAGSAGTNSAGIVFGGNSGSATGVTEEFTAATTAANYKTITTS